MSVAVALADKIDTLTGFWAIDEKPTGSKDPYALRRAALGVIRLVVGNGVSVKLLPIVQFARSLVLEQQTARLARVAREKSAELAAVLAKLLSQDEGLELPADYYEEKIEEIREFAGDDAITGDIARIDLLWRASFPDLAKQFGDYWNWRDLHPDEPNFIPNEAQGTSIPADLLAFLHDRLKVTLRDQGIRPARSSCEIKEFGMT
ncbi:MAG: hypothetical protein B7Z10_08815 [Rhodobacterales bacterium 32-66-7]|nr:MAG: hypothetical protein B7Z10_08815 [Rhodobacterales bacterium 32-66-7]